MFNNLTTLLRTELESCYAEYELPASGIVFNWVLASVRIFEQLDYADFDQKYLDLRCVLAVLFLWLSPILTPLVARRFSPLQ